MSAVLPQASAAAAGSPSRQRVDSASTQAMNNKLPEASSMLSSCRDLAAELLSHSLSTMLDKIEESLFELADKALDRETYNLYMQARGEAQAKRAAIEEEFRRRFIDGFDKTIKGRGKAESGFDKIDFDSLELSLVQHDDYEEDLAVTNITSKLSNKIGDDLSAFNQRIGHLMQRPEGQHDDNPLGPQAIVEAFRSACMKIESDLNVRLLVLKQFEQVAAENVPNVYQNLNRFLIERNILPVLPKGRFRRRNLGGAPRQSVSQPGSAALQGEYQPAGSYASQMGFGAGGFAPASSAGIDLPAYAVGNEQELLSSLQQLLAFNQMMQVAPGAAAATGSDLTVMGPAITAAPVFLSSVGQSFLDALNRLQAGVIEGALTDQGELDADALVSGDANVLHQIKTTSLASSLGHVDAMTIDIVAMLFDYIFDDANIPAPMKALIGRLQIPVLKVAMLDSKFFARKQHPTRRLLDALAQAALGWSEADGLEDRLYKKIAELVDGIVQGFDENIGLFDTTLADLQAFLAEEEQKAESVTEANAAQLVAAERAELAARQAEHVVTQRLALASNLPELIQTFLKEQWQRVLAHTAELAETDKEPWQDAVIAMDDLIWSVAPKVGVEERLRLVNLLPKLLKRLERGTENAGVDRAHREAFFAELVHCHALAIKSGLRPAEPQAPFADEVAPAAPEQVAAAPIEFHEPAPAPAAPIDQASLLDLPVIDIGPQAGAFQITDGNWDDGLDKYRDYDDVVANQLARGSWVEFKQGHGEPVRAKLAWVSPMKSRYLFTNRQGQNGMEYALADLITMFKRGDAVLIESGPSVERAVSDMIGMLQPVAA
ncbi:DUF1631 domain-containing protein [Chitinimonas sp.]|uniref:DUF1631 domain-containing protein n=1 Tax=Chitinimonas sp. TaxID=1934313 RepID=UPI0035AE744E